MNYSNKLQELKKEVVDYITSVLKHRGSNYELTDPANYEDGNDIEEEVYDLPRAHVFGKYNVSAEEYPIIIINIKDNDELEFVGLGGCFEGLDEDENFTTGSLTIETLTAIADLVYKLENGNQFSLEIGKQIDWKFGLVTRTVERISEKHYQIHDFSDGWHIAKVDYATLGMLLNGDKSLLDLNWK